MTLEPDQQTETGLEHFEEERGEFHYPSSVDKFKAKAGKVNNSTCIP